MFTIIKVVSQIVENAFWGKVEKSFSQWWRTCKKFLYPDPVTDDFQHLISSSLSVDTSLVRFEQSSSFYEKLITDKMTQKQTVVMVWHCGSTLFTINEVNPCRAQLVLGWVNVSWFSSRCPIFISECNQPPKANSAFHPSGVGKWGPALVGKAKAGMVQSVSGWTQSVQVKLWEPLRTRAIPEHLRGVFMTRCYSNPRLPQFYLVVQTNAR